MAPWLPIASWTRTSVGCAASSSLWTLRSTRSKPSSALATAGRPMAAEPSGRALARRVRRLRSVRVRAVLVVLVVVLAPLALVAAAAYHEEHIADRMHANLRDGATDAAREIGRTGAGERAQLT